MAQVTCWKCGGSGYLPQYAHIKGGICYPCNGTGKLSEADQKSLSLKAFEKGTKKGGKTKHLFDVDPKLLDRKQLEKFRTRIKTRATELGVKLKAGFTTETALKKLHEAYKEKHDDLEGTRFESAKAEERPKETKTEPKSEPKKEAPKPKVEPKKETPVKVAQKHDIDEITKLVHTSIVGMSDEEINGVRAKLRGIMESLGKDHTDKSIVVMKREIREHFGIEKYSKKGKVNAEVKVEAKPKEEPKPKETSPTYHEVFRANMQREFENLTQESPSMKRLKEDFDRIVEASIRKYPKLVSNFYDNGGSVKLVHNNDRYHGAYSVTNNYINLSLDRLKGGSRTPVKDISLTLAHEMTHAHHYISVTEKSARAFTTGRGGKKENEELKRTFDMTEAKLSSKALIAVLTYRSYLKGESSVGDFNKLATEEVVLDIAKHYPDIYATANFREYLAVGFQHYLKIEDKNPGLFSQYYPDLYNMLKKVMKGVHDFAD